jgi:hypothetical protein
MALLRDRALPGWLVWETVYFVTWGSGRLPDAPGSREGFRERDDDPRRCSRPFPEAFT